MKFDPSNIWVKNSSRLVQHPELEEFIARGVSLDKGWTPGEAVHIDSLMSRAVEYSAEYAQFTLWRAYQLAVKDGSISKLLLAVDLRPVGVRLLPKFMKCSPMNATDFMRQRISWFPPLLFLLRKAEDEPNQSVKTHWSKALDDYQPVDVKWPMPGVLDGQINAFLRQAKEEEPRASFLFVVEIPAG